MKNKTKDKDIKNNHTKKKKNVENEKIKGPKVTLGKKDEEKIAKKAEKIIKQGKTTYTQIDSHLNSYMK